MAQLDFKDFENLENFLDTNFEDFQGFPWSSLTSEALENKATTANASESLPTANVIQPDGLYSVRTSGDTSLCLNPSDRQHRLLNEKGLAYSLPDLANMPFQLSTPAQATYGGLLNAQCEDSVEHQAGVKERLSSLGSGESSHGVHKGKGQLSLTERNKQAQRRHRQRQRDRTEQLEAQVKQLMEERQTLTAEKAALAGQNAVLTQVLQMRDEQLQRASPSSQPITPVVKCEAEEDTSRRESAVSTGLAESLASILTLTVRDEEIKLSPGQVKAMSPQEIARMWAEYMSALMKQLSATRSGNPEITNRAEARMSELLQEVLVLLMRYALGDLHKMKQFVVGKTIAKAAEPGEGGRESQRRGEGPEMWQAAARNLGVSGAQRAALCQLRRLFMQKQAKLVALRQEAVARLHRAIPNAASSHDMAAQFLKAEDAMGEIHENLRKENQLIVDLIYTLFIKIASPSQAARCLVQSFPWYPDSLCILTCIAAEAGDQQAMQLIQQQQPLEGLPSAQHSEQASAGEEFSPSLSPKSL